MKQRPRRNPASTYAHLPTGRLFVLLHSSLFRGTWGRHQKNDLNQQSEEWASVNAVQAYTDKVSQSLEVHVFDQNTVIYQVHKVRTKVNRQENTGCCLWLTGWSKMASGFPKIRHSLIRLHNMREQRRFTCLIFCAKFWKNIFVPTTCH